MDVKLDWQQDLEDEGWPQQPDGPQPPQHNKVRLRWALLLGLALIAVSALVVWAARYVLEEYGVGWIDPLFSTGIATVLQAIAAEKGWSWQELEADVQRFLLEKQ
jgi:hypothetical protein